MSQIPEKNKEMVRKLYEDCFNTGRLELLDQLIAEDFVGIYGQKGPAAFAQIVRSLRQGFPDIHWTIEDLFAADDRVAVRWTWQGTHQAAFGGFAASHKQVTDHAMAIYQFRGDRIIQAWVQTDRLGFLQQIGIVPPDLGAPPPQKQ